MKTIIAEKKLSTVEQLKQHIEFGKDCALCIPYVKLIFITGKTDFEPLVSLGNKNE